MKILLLIITNNISHLLNKIQRLPNISKIEIVWTFERALIKSLRDTWEDRGACRNVILSINNVEKS